MVDLEQASLYSLLPLLQSQDPTPFVVKPLITVISGSTSSESTEFLILSWTGSSALGVFITGEGDPVRGTLEWPSYPKAVCKSSPLSLSLSLSRRISETPVFFVTGLDYPHITSLLPNETIEVHSVETQAIVQVISAPESWSDSRLGLVASLHGYLVPSTQKRAKMRKVKVELVRGGD